MATLSKTLFLIIDKEICYNATANLLILRKIMNAKSKSTGCPVKEAVEALDKHQADFMKYLEKESAYCKKTMASLKKKKAKASETKAKASSRKSAIATKVKSKPTAANKAQLEKANDTLKKASDDLKTISEEMANMKVVTDRMTSLHKERTAEAKMLTKFRADRAKEEAKKLAKKKKSPKAKKKTTSVHEK